ncbi:hypothetical protein [Streptomyces boncukensis]|uniref:Uncharacterized protein n=1 Tax=Streptomyces boncukensis TaxID=2711219 RepID=A0A6G4WVK9_9ACTN|nr:hypothetical protein [Streptomyces boncukensis]NGO69148.1 hypothetical protein [Streptomyces boncukensis]
MGKSTTEDSGAVAESATAEILYSAEVRRVDGNYTLVIHDHLCGSVETYSVSSKAVKKLPSYLAMLRSKLS